MGGGEEAEKEALRLKALAEEKFRGARLKPALKYARRALRLCPDLEGASEMVAALKILLVAGDTSASSSSGGGGETSPPWYEVLQVEPFSHINAIKKQYKKLALTLHPDKNPSVASEEAFKLVAEAFRCLSDKARRKEYDLKLRVAMQTAAAAAAASTEPEETFWTACSICRLLHQFERRYVGHKLICPNCSDSFLSVEADSSASAGDGFKEESEDDRSDALAKFISRIRLQKRKVRNLGFKRKMGSVEEVLERAPRATIVPEIEEKGKSRLANKASRRSKPKTARVAEEMTLAEMQSEMMPEMTLAEMQSKMMRKARQEKMTKLEMENECGKEKEKPSLSKSRGLGIEKRSVVKERSLYSSMRRSSNSMQKENLEPERHRGSKMRDLEIMAVEDSDFYDFDKDRVERSFKKGQVWAIYDDDDGMPRNYGLIEEVVSVNPFQVVMCWLDLQDNEDQGSVFFKSMGFHVSCGRFRVTRKTSIDTVNVFSHVVDYDRAARELYWIYPKKGSVWALYKDLAFDAEGRNLSKKDKRCYDIVVFLTTYSDELHGLSMAYLEKVDGFRTIFKRKEIGCHAIKWIEKAEVRFFSHQIPARKLSGFEVPHLTQDCWELDPASLPPDLLTIGWREG